jgi:hypothetical protein
VASQVGPRCVPIGQIDDDFIGGMAFKLLLASVVIVDRVNGSLVGQVCCIGILVFLGTLDLPCSLDPSHITH